MNSDPSRYHKWSSIFICCIVFLYHNKEFAFSPSILTPYIVTYRHIDTTTITSLSTTLHIQTHNLHTHNNMQPHTYTHNNTQPPTYTHIIPQLIIKSPTYPIYTNTTHKNIHYIPTSIPTTPLIIVHNFINIGNIYHITHLHLKTPKSKTIHYYTWNNSKIIILSGDIQPNPGPISNITKNLPLEYQHRIKQYFLLNTTSLKPRYAHLEKLFTPYLMHGPQNTTSHELTHLQKHKPTLSKNPIHLQTYILITIYNHTPQICNQRLIADLEPIGYTLLLKTPTIYKITTPLYQTSHNTYITLTHHKPYIPHTIPNPHPTITLKHQDNYKAIITSPHHTYAHDPQHITQHIIQTKPTPSPPIHPTIHISNFLYLTHTHSKTPKGKLIKYYIWINTILLIISGDIETNPAPPPYTSSKTFP